MPLSVPTDLEHWHPVDVCTWLATIEDDPDAVEEDVRRARAVAAAALIGWCPPPSPNTPAHEH